MKSNIRVLYLDDEDYLREVVDSMVHSLGYEIVCVENIRQALETIAQAKRDNNDFTIAIIDLTIRGESGGSEANAAIHAIAPDLPLVVTSGNTEHSAMLDPQGYGFKAAIAKPFLKRELAIVLDSVQEQFVKKD